MCVCVEAWKRGSENIHLMSLLVLAICVFLGVTADAAFPSTDALRKAKAVVSNMTMDQKFQVLNGIGWTIRFQNDHYYVSTARAIISTLLARDLEIDISTVRSSPHALERLA